MANKSARDKCFEDAVDALNDALPDNQKIDIQHQQPWGQIDGKWRPLGVGERLWNWITDKTIPYRVPDWTLTQNGRPIAGDNKFSGDSYNPRRLGRSGQTQQADQNQMNEDHHPGNSDYQNLNLNPETCNCKGEPQKERVEVPAPSFSGAYAPVPISPRVPSFGGAPAPAPVPEGVPGGFGFPDFVFP